jgi:hypothetical protein
MKINVCPSGGTIRKANPGSARERFARPPAGTALTPPSGSHPDCALRWARCFGFNRMQKRLSNAVAESGDVSSRKSLQQQPCSRETSNLTGFDTRCDRNRKSIRNLGKDSQRRMGFARALPILRAINFLDRQSARWERHERQLILLPAKMRGGQRPD